MDIAAAVVATVSSLTLLGALLRGAISYGKLDAKIEAHIETDRITGIATNKMLEEMRGDIKELLGRRD